MKSIWQVIHNLMKEHFWGELTISFKDGKPVKCEKRQSIKLEEETNI